ncbi:MAG: phytoene desaturase family protein [Polyangia bacterium]|jgi:diapolycopene oxygenase|nr:phytoene desaturase family protein [Polyangia bacterium]
MTRKRNEKVLVIGGGLGGLSAAAALAAEGFQVELFEKNDHLGGKLCELETEGFKFDLGPSIIILPQLFRRIWTRAGRVMEDYVRLEEVTPQWRSFWEDGTVLDLHPDMARMEKELEKLGQRAEGYWAFMEYSRMLWKFAEEAYLERGADTLGEVMKGHSLIEVAKRTDLFSSMDAGVRRYVSEPHVVDMLNFFIKYVGSSAYDSPAILNLLPYSQLGYGLWYVQGGMYNLARGLRRLLEDLGVVLHLGTEVTSIDKQGGKVTGLRTADGDRHQCDIIVSNMEVIPAYQRLLGDGGRMRVKLYERIFEPACSGLVLHIGLDRVFPEVHHHNFVFSRDPRQHWHQVHHLKEIPDDPTLYLVSPTVTNPALAPKGHSILKVLPHIPYCQEPPFSQGDYERLKERCYDKLERIGLKGLREAIVVEHMLTPEDLLERYYSNRGAIYGVVSDRSKNYALRAPKQSAIYENLFFVGGSVNPGGGTCMVVLSGQKACDLIVEKYGG